MSSKSLPAIVLINNTPRYYSKNSKSAKHFKDVFLTKKFLDYLTRPRANINSLNTEELHQEWRKQKKKNGETFEKFLKDILDKQYKNRHTDTSRNLFQILPNNGFQVVDVNDAKNQIGNLDKNQAVWPYVISFKDYELICKNELITLEDYAKFLSPELNKWMKDNFLKVEDLNIFGAVHFDTKHPHIQLWISEKYPTKKSDGVIRFDKRNKFNNHRVNFEENLSIKLINQGLQKNFVNDELANNRKNNFVDQVNFISEKSKKLKIARSEIVKDIKETKMQSFENDLNFIKAVSSISNVSNEQISSVSSFDEFYKLVNESRKEKQLVSLVLNDFEISNILETPELKQKRESLKKSSKYFKFLNKEQKKSIEDFYTVMKQSNKNLQNHIQNFSFLINELKKYQQDSNLEIANLARNVVKKEEKELYFNVRNQILKKIHKELDEKEVQYSQYYRSGLTKEEKIKKDFSIVYEFKKGLKRVGG
ncbi:Uncharacterised protein [Mesomycoplasma conjunctivae]|uniref:Uncharacterized protein n=1 Tax=Mesomycoplasma conjunctivae (strain ATCC 25834 / NCTC 10147 / HRC/581) TaxID=572263 RepID=C5J6E9_MESCH|nr:hypothetical protein [Mesomycoplasma conjunctivae]CAT05041.1 HYPOTHETICAL PROTEIN MCJ_003520 [Mesomycoplasma conjunctivae]VEU66301.1 Uncharacterised protein [Mesomycoplasma conjunctivae]